LSGIGGILRLDHRPIRTGEVASMRSYLERRGPDGSRVWQVDHVALVYAHLATHAQVDRSRLPLSHAETGCTITAELRLDNRSELIETLGLPARRGWSDAEIVLEAYLQWGAACAEHLLGDFAFAIWDPREQHLFCARDQVGMRQFIYHHSAGRLFGFATDAIALLRHDEIPVRINEERLADCLEELEAHDFVSTPFANLHRLPPAHAMLVSRSSLKTWRYWSIEPQPRLQLSSDDEYAEALLDVFTKAVRARLRDCDGIGSMLSGGMDSGSIVAVAAGLLAEQGQPPLRTFSAIDTRPGCVETDMIRRTQAIGHVEPHSVPVHELGDCGDELARLFFGMDDPFDGWMNLQRAVYLLARRTGTKVVMDGTPGDLVVGLGDAIGLHISSGRYGAALREAWGEKRFWGMDYPTFVPLARKLWRRSLPGPLLAMRDAQVKRRILSEDDRKSPLTREFSQRVDMPRRREKFRAAIRPVDESETSRRLLGVLHPFSVLARERYDRTAAALGIETRAPFMDVRLLEFSLSLPADQLQRNGWHKLLLRRAMAGLLPEAVRWRKGNESVNWRFTERLMVDLKPELDSVVAEQLRPYVRQEAIEAFLGAKSADAAVAKFDRIIYSAVWLKRINEGAPLGGD